MFNMGVIRVMSVNFLLILTSLPILIGSSEVSEMTQDYVTNSFINPEGCGDIKLEPILAERQVRCFYL